MKPQQTPYVRIAVPSYENRVMPRFGHAREFHIAVADIKIAEIVEIQKCISDYPSAFSTIEWLHRQEIDTLLCSGIHPRFQEALRANNIHVYWGYRGEVNDVIHQWLSGDYPDMSDDIMPCDGKFRNRYCERAVNIKSEGVLPHENYHQCKRQKPGQSD